MKTAEVIFWKYFEKGKRRTNYYDAIPIKKKPQSTKNHKTEQQPKERQSND